MREYNDYEIPPEIASREGQLNPYPAFRTLRSSSPIRYDDDREVWDVFRYDHVNEVLVDPELYSSEGTSHFGKHLLASDPPDHTELRDMISEYFTGRFISGIEPMIERRAEQFLTEAIEDGSQFDFLRDVAIPYPISIIADLMEIPQEHRRMYRRWSENLLKAPVASEDEAVEQSHQRRGETRAEMEAFFEEIVEEREQNPGDDIVSALIEAENRVPFFTRELTINTCNILMVGGHITTSAFLSNAMLAFLNHDLVPELRSGEVSLELALEEALRYRSPVSRFDRLTTDEAELGDTTIPEGERIILWAASANRDERVFDQPDEFRPERDPQTPHIAFGRGIHTCIGNQLARTEGRILFETFFELFDEAELAADTLDPFASTMVNGVENLPVAVG